MDGRRHAFTSNNKMTQISCTLNGESTIYPLAINGSPLLKARAEQNIQ